MRTTPSSLSITKPFPSRFGGFRDFEDHKYVQGMHSQQSVSVLMCIYQEMRLDTAKRHGEHWTLKASILEVLIITAHEQVVTLSVGACGIVV